MSKVKSPEWVTSNTAAYNKSIKSFKYNTLVPENTDKHQVVSFIKSGLRILGLIIIPFSLFIGLALLVLAEIIGIVEELV